MNLLEGHLYIGVVMTIWALWMLTQSMLRYVLAPLAFEASVWYPAKLPGKWRFIELYLVLAAAAYYAIWELVWMVEYPTVVDQYGNMQWVKGVYVEHVAAGVFFAVYSLSALLTEGGLWWKPRPLPHGWLYMLLGAASLHQFLVFYLHSNHNFGIEVYYHNLFIATVAVCICCLTLEAAFPTSFIISTIRGMAFLLQGLWLIQVFFSVHTPEYRPLGCHGYPVMCDSSFFFYRACTFANAQFSICGVAVLVASLALYLILRHMYGETEYSLPVAQPQSPRMNKASLADKFWESGSSSESSEGPAEALRLSVSGSQVL